MRKSNSMRNRESVSYWSSYSDMMAALILVLVLILCVTLVIDRIQIEKREQEYNEILEKYESITGVRKEIVDKLKKEFGDNSDIVLDMETGDVVFKSQILFDFDKTDLKAAGKDFLQDFFPRYVQILMQGEAKDNISEIIVEGHTDSDGGYVYNLSLSQGRAASVVMYCMDEKNNILSSDEIAYLQSKLTANGKSYSKPKATKEESRRVEIKFSLYEEEQIKKLMEMLSAE